MTDMPDRLLTPVTRSCPAGPPTRGYRLEECHWGYRIAPHGRTRNRDVFLTAWCAVGGAALVAAAGVLAVTGGLDDALFRLPIIGPTAALGLAMIWNARRGTQVQVEVDTSNGEVRAVYRSRTGASTVLACYGFDCVGGVFIDRPAGAPATLVLRYRNTARALFVTAGAEPDLVRLRDRMARDLIVACDANGS